MNYKDLIERAAWTFFQAFLGTFVVGIPLVLSTLDESGYDAAKAILISSASGALAAGFSALKTYLKTKW